LATFNIRAVLSRILAENLNNLFWITNEIEPGAKLKTIGSRIRNPFFLFSGQITNKSKPSAASWWLLSFCSYQGEMGLIQPGSTAVVVVQPPENWF
jgi:hypothetical protein